MYNNVRFGLVCMANGIDKGSFKTMTKKSFLNGLQNNKNNTYNRLKQITLTNLHNTLDILRYCIQSHIQVYRFSSDLIPLATLKENEWHWWEDKDVLKVCSDIKFLVEFASVRTSFHNSQFCILTNWERPEVFQNSLDDLIYHNRMCELFGCETILIHVGGAYGNKQKAVETFIEYFYQLPLEIQNRLHLENDDTTYNVEEVLNVCKIINRPMVLDFHHDKCLPSSNHVKHYINDIVNTWQGNRPKMHLSSSKDDLKVIKSHHDYINVDDFEAAYEVIGNLDCDIMIEAKQKDLAIFKLIKDMEVI
jgi:UV DNA damage endonuclease